MTAMAMTSLLGVAALAAEVGGWYMLRRSMQSAVDAAAFAGAVNLDKNRYLVQAVAAPLAVEAAKGVAARNGFTSGVTAEVLGTDRVQVAVQRLSTSFLARAVGGGDSVVRARAVAQVVEVGAPPCIHALVDSISVGNETDLAAPKCTLASDKEGSDGLKIGSGGSVANGTGRITAANVVLHGGCHGCAEAMQDPDGTGPATAKLTLTQSATPTTYAQKLNNPYQHLDNWSPSASETSSASCKAPPGGGSGGAPAVVGPGCYTGLSVGSNAPIDLKPGAH